MTRTIMSNSNEGVFNYKAKFTENRKLRERGESLDGQTERCVYMQMLNGHIKEQNK